jgi:ABC-2 type transport system ATP-binding protein
MINIDHLTKRYGTVTAVDGLSFEVGPGRVTGFLGAQRRRQDHHAADAAGPARPAGKAAATARRCR